MSVLLEVPDGGLNKLMCNLMPQSYLVTTFELAMDEDHHYTPLVHEIWVHTRSSYMGEKYVCISSSSQLLQLQLYSYNCKHT